MRYSSTYDITRTLKTSSEAKNAIVPMYTAPDGRIYGDDSLSSTLVLGRPNTGKTANILIPAVNEVISKGESVIVGDSKGVIFAKTVQKARENGYKIYVFNYANPQNSDGFDPIALQAVEYKHSKYSKEKSMCSLNSLARAIVPNDKDAFWEMSPIECIEASALYLYEFFDPLEVSTTALRDVLSAGEKKYAGELAFKDMEALLDNRLEISNPMSGIANSPNETRASTLAIAKASLSSLCRTEGMRCITEKNNVDIFNLDVEEKSIFYFVLPEETHIYNTLAAVMLDCIIKRYYEANRVTGEPINRRLNVIIDELGSLAAALPAFDTYCTTARSRNIKIIASLQSIKQLYQAFTDDKAQIIEDSVGNIISFSCSNIETLKRLSERSGVYTNPISGKTSPTISADSIARFESGQALVFSGPLVFTTQFAFDEEKSTDVPIIFPKIEGSTIKQRTDVMKPIWEKKKEEIEKMISEKMSREIEQTTFKPKKKNMFSRIFRRVFKKKKRTPFDSLPF